MNNPKQGKSSDIKKAYVKPVAKRVELALEETLSSGCKLSGQCDDPDAYAAQGGS